MNSKIIEYMIVMISGVAAFLAFLSYELESGQNIYTVILMIMIGIIINIIIVWIGKSELHLFPLIPKKSLVGILIFFLVAMISLIVFDDYLRLGTIFVFASNIGLVIIGFTYLRFTLREKQK